MPAFTCAAGAYLTEIIEPLTSALVYACKHSSSSLPLENSTDTEGKLVPVARLLLSCSKRNGSKPSPDFSSWRKLSWKWRPKEQPWSQADVTVADKVCINPRCWCHTGREGRKQALFPGKLIFWLRLGMLQHHLHSTRAGRLGAPSLIFLPPN